MEAGWRRSFSSSCSGGDGGVGGGGGGGDSGGQNGNFAANNAWDIWDIGSTTTTTTNTAAGTRYDWGNHGTTAAARGTEESVVHALLFGMGNDNAAIQNAVVGSNAIRQRMPDPHMMCLKLGKRHYCECSVVPDRHTAEDSSSSSTKRGKPPYPYHMTDIATTTTITVWPASTPAAQPPRCQVEGCGVSLSNTKEYYRRHKVCEIHSKAPKVVVLGLQQRFCQQCSRFHGVTEFDEAKRSCRRRLEGHNQRRRKGTIPNSLPRNFPNSHATSTLMAAEQQFPPSPLLKPGCALSLLSSPKTEPWVSSSGSGDLSLRCSAALSDLIAANRATAVVGHLWNQNGYQQEVMENMIHTPTDTQMWDRFNDDDHTTMTLDLMQASSSFGFWPFVHQGEV
ncbi:hypothetical protein LXL04_026897 [Taraxacum kok-saghyz]